MKQKKVQELYSLIKSRSNDFIILSREISENPELGFEERFACARQCELLKKIGFNITTPYAGLATAYKATRGNGKPTFCFVAEYDALPEVGHGCGHNLICAAAIAAGWTLSSTLEKEKIEGTTVVMGTPAEESKGGKVIMLQNNALHKIDAVMMAHPSRYTTLDAGSTAVRRFEVSFAGQSSHSAVNPELGLNALNAVLLLFTGINAWREGLQESSRVNGIINNGGSVPNIIPDKSSCRFFLRSPDDNILDQMEMRFREIVNGAALMTGTKAQVNTFGIPYKSRQPCSAFNRIYKDAAESLGMQIIVPEHPGRGSSDFGDFSHVCPSLHPYFAIVKNKITGHSIQFAEAARSDFAMQQMLKAATAMAFCGYNFMVNPKLRNEAFSGFPYN